MDRDNTVSSMDDDDDHDDTQGIVGQMRRYLFILRSCLIYLDLLGWHYSDLLLKTVHADELHRYAKQYGKAPGNTCKLLILGHSRAGKTSLSKKLRGKPFDPKEKPTFGIKMDKIEKVDEKWREKDPSSGSSPDEEPTAWFLAKELADKYRKDKTAVTNEDRIPLFTLGLLLLYGLITSSFIVATHQSPILYFINVSAVCSVYLVISRNYFFYRVGMCASLFIPIVQYLIPPVVELWNDYNTIGFSDGIVGTSIMFNVGGLLFGSICSSELTPVFAMGILCIWSPEDPSATEVNGVAETIDPLPFAIYTGALIGLLLAKLSLDYLRKFRQRQGRNISVVSFDRFSLLIVMQMVAYFAGVGLMYGSHGSPKRPFLTVITFGISLGASIRFGYQTARNRQLMTYVQILPMPFYIILTCLISTTVVYFLKSDSNVGVEINNVNRDSLCHIFFFRVSAVLLLCAAELEEYRVLSKRKPAYVRATKRFRAASLSESEENKLPITIGVWDFAGESIYYNTHHAFMAKQDVYIVVFDMEAFANEVEREQRYEELVRFWLYSIRAHSEGPVFLVGTHLDKVASDIIDTLREFFDRKLKRYFQSLQHSERGVVHCKLSPFFVIDNTGNATKDDTEKLKDKISEKVKDLPSMTGNYPIKWRTLLNEVQQVRNASSIVNPLMMSIQELLEISEAHNFTPVEVRHMLEFFNETGEVIYDCVDSLLRQYIFWDPQTLVKVIESLTSSKKPDDIHGIDEVRWEQLRKKGILSSELVHQVVNAANENDKEVILRVLASKDLICQVNGMNSSNVEALYIVPALLPKNWSTSGQNNKWLKTYYIDLGNQIPDAILMRIMCRCASDSSLQWFSSRQLLCQQGGYFTYGDGFYFRLHLIKSPDQNLIMINIITSNGKRPFDLLRHLWHLMDTLRRRSFPKLHFYMGIKCPFDGDHQYHWRYSCDDDMMHVIPLASRTNPFPDGVTIVQKMCLGREVNVDLNQIIQRVDDDSVDSGRIHVPGLSCVGPGSPYVGPGASSLSINGSNNTVIQAERSNIGLQHHPEPEPRGQEISVPHNSAHNPHQVFISCASGDIQWSRDNIVNELANHNVVINECLDIEGGANGRKIDECRVFISVISREYLQDSTNRLEMERELARLYHKRIILVRRGNVHLPHQELFDVDEQYRIPDSAVDFADRLVGSVNELLGP